MVQEPAAAIPPNESTPPLGDSASDHWLRKQFDYNNIEHLIKTGRILSLVYDIETTDLNHMFAALTQFSGKIVDLQGQIIDQVKINVQVPEDVALSPQAAIVTQSSPKDLYNAEGRVPQHVAAAQIMEFFRNPYRKLWDQLADQAITITGDGSVTKKEKEEVVRVYTVKSPDGGKEATIRLHQGGKFLSYKCPEEQRFPDGPQTYHDKDGTRWRKIYAPAMTKGHNIKRFDDRVLWSTLHRAVSDEIFMTHTKKFRRFRMDTLELAKLTALLDLGGEDGFKCGSNIDKKSNTSYDSFTLSSLMEHNKHDTYSERGLNEGVRMPDGSIYDKNLAHANADYDVDATIALEAYMRKRAPDVVRTVEENSDFDQIKPFLLGDKAFNAHPVLAFTRNLHPKGAVLHFGVCADINEEIDERRQAVMIRTDLDQKLEDFTYHGKKLVKKNADDVEMTVDDLAKMLEEQRGEANALCEIIDLRKNPPVVPAKMAYDRGVGGDPERHEVNRRFVLKNSALCRRLMEAHSKAMPPMPDYKTIPNPQPEHHLFTGIAQSKRYEIIVDGKKVLLEERVHKAWNAALDRNRAIDNSLKRAVKADMIECESPRPEALKDFIKRIKKVDNDLKRLWGTTHVTNVNPTLSDDAEEEVGPGGKPKKSLFSVLPLPDKSFIPPENDTITVSDPKPGKKRKTKKVPHVMDDEECQRLTANAKEYLWKLRAELMYDFHDTTTRFTVQQRIKNNGKIEWHDIDYPDLNKMNENELATHLRTGEYRIDMEELDYTSELVARMFRDTPGRIQWLKDYMANKFRDDKERRQEEIHIIEDWDRLFAAERALRIHGAPHLDPEKQQWLTAIKSMKDIVRIENNQLPEADLRADGERWGLGDTFMHNSDASQQILGECKAHAQAQLDANPFTPEMQRLVGYDPDNGGLPIEHVKDRYVVPAGAKVLTLDVPDRVLDERLRHPRTSHRFIMINPDPAHRKALEEADEGTVLFLRGAQTGRTFLAAKHIVLPREKITPDDHYYNPVYQDAANRYKDSGEIPPEAEQFLPIAVEALAPVPSKVNSAVQTIKVQRWEDFQATVSPKLSGREAPVTGFVIRDFGPKLERGPVRLQGMVKDDHKPGQTESGWEVPTTITRVRTLTLEKALEQMTTGTEQFNAAIELGFGDAAAAGTDPVQALRHAVLDEKSITDRQAKDAGYKSLDLLEKLIKKESFTPYDAIRYGYAGPSQMRNNIKAQFTAMERGVNRPDNIFHFVDIEPADKQNMSWYRPGHRPTVKLAGNVVDITPPASAPSTEPVLPTETGAKMPWTQRGAGSQTHPRSGSSEGQDPGTGSVPR